MNKRVIAFLIGITLLSPLIVYCKSPEEARIALGQIGIQYTPDAFVEAVQKGDVVVVKLFLDAGMQPNTPNNNGGIALISASDGKHTDVLKLLLDKGADVNAKTMDGYTAFSYTALMYATKMKSIITVKLLLDKGADVNAKNENGSTVLMEAAQSGAPDVFKLLLDKGADVNAKTKSGTTVLKLALGLKRTEIINLLKQAGVDVGSEEIIEAVKTCMEIYAAHNGYYPKNVTSVTDLVKILGDSFPTTIKTDGTSPSLIAAVTNATGNAYRIYAIGRDANHCYGLAQDGKEVGPDTLANCQSLLGNP